MVTPVLHVLPLTFRLIFQLLFCCVLSGTFSERHQCATMPVVDEAFLQSTVAKNVFACGALNGSLHHRLRRA